MNTMTAPRGRHVRLPQWWLWLLLAVVDNRAADRILTQEYATAVSPESQAERADRHRAVAARRQGPVVIVHRGAAAVAPENSLEACMAALDYGADGCEVDVRRTRDGVLVLFHDEGLERVTSGFGRVSQATFRELSALKPRIAGGRPLFGSPLTFATLLDAARQRRMLLHLDLKEPELESEVARLLEEADAWDHVVHVNAENATNLVRDGRLRLLAYKAPGLYAGRLDLDPNAVAAALDRPGHMILVDDPRVAARVLGRPAYLPQAYTKTLRLLALPPLSRDFPPVAEESPLALMRALAAQPDADAPVWLLGLMEGRSSATPPRQRVIERAWAAQRLGELGTKSRLVVTALLRQAQQPSPHPDRVYRGLDAAMAIRAIGRLQASETARALIELLHRPINVGPTPGGEASGPRWEAQEERPELERFLVTRFVIPALGEMRCRTARRFLAGYVRASEDEVRRFGPLQYEAATQGLLRQRLTWSAVADLLRSPNPAVRGTTLLECVDNPTEERKLALRVAAPWGLSLPRRGR